MTLEYALIGFVAGLLISFTGMGGGAIVTPLLLASGISPTVAVSTDLVFGAITKFIGAAPHVRSRAVDLRVVGWLCCGSVPGSLLAVLVLRVWRTRDASGADMLVKHAIAVILMLVAIITIAQLATSVLAPGRLQPLSRLRVNGRPAPRLLIPAGAVAGFAVGMTSIGAGTLLMAILLPVWPATAVTLVGTDIAHGAILASVAALGHLAIGEVNFTVVGSLLVGSIPGVLIGTQVARRVPSRVLKGAYAAFLFTIGLRLL